MILSECGGHGRARVAFGAVNWRKDGRSGRRNFVPHVLPGDHFHGVGPRTVVLLKNKGAVRLFAHELAQACLKSSDSGTGTHTYTGTNGTLTGTEANKLSCFGAFADAMEPRTDCTIHRYLFDTH